jgi:putative addiction module component (TIGR02574 family)
VSTDAHSSYELSVNVLPCPVRPLCTALKEKLRIARKAKGKYYLNMTTALQELETLSISERVQVVEDLWDSIARSNANLPVPQWQKDELARRKARFLRNPDSGESWDQVKRAILEPR